MESIVLQTILQTCVQLAGSEVTRMDATLGLEQLLGLARNVVRVTPVATFVGVRPNGGIIERGQIEGQIVIHLEPQIHEDLSSVWYVERHRHRGCQLQYRRCGKQQHAGRSTGQQKNDDRNKDSVVLLLWPAHVDLKQRDTSLDVPAFRSSDLFYSDLLFIWVSN